MSIKATVDGTAYSGITTINAGGKAITLAETGTIATPTATKTQSITANGTISVDVTNYKTITITTNVQSSSGGSDTTVTLSSISATYAGGAVDAGTSVNSLTGITVTATYSDSSTEVVTGYTLSGTIAEGSNTITVSYSGKTCTFTVTGNAVSGSDSTEYEQVTATWKRDTYYKVEDGVVSEVAGYSGTAVSTLNVQGKTRIKFVSAFSGQSAYVAFKVISGGVILTDVNGKTWNTVNVSQNGAFGAEYVEYDITGASLIYIQTSFTGEAHNDDHFTIYVR